MSNNSKGFPVSHIVGFLMSLVLTFAAVGVALKTSLSARSIIWIIGTFAILQAALQLFMFMHMNEGENAKEQTINVIAGVLTAVVVVAGSIWVMSFGM